MASCFGDKDSETPISKRRYRSRWTPVSVSPASARPSPPSPYLQLRDNGGRLSLDDPVSRHLDWFNLRYPGAPEITIRNLLTHSSGASARLAQPHVDGMRCAGMGRIRAGAKGRARRRAHPTRSLPTAMSATPCSAALLRRCPVKPGRNISSAISLIRLGCRKPIPYRRATTPCWLLAIHSSTTTMNVDRWPSS